MRKEGGEGTGLRKGGGGTVLYTFLWRKSELQGVSCKRKSIQYQEAYRHLIQHPYLPTSVLTALRKLSFLLEASLPSGCQSVLLPRAPFPLRVRKHNSAIFPTFLISRLIIHWRPVLSTETCGIRLASLTASSLNPVFKFYHRRPPNLSFYPSSIRPVKDPIFCSSSFLQKSCKSCLGWWIT